jgi:hypothetical protein
MEIFDPPEGAERFSTKENLREAEVVPITKRGTNLSLRRLDLSRHSNGLLFRANRYRQSRLFVSQLRCRVSFLGMLQGGLGMLAAPFVSSFTAILRRGAMAFGGVLMLLRSNGVRFHYVGFFIHGNTPFLNPDDPG